LLRSAVPEGIATADEIVLSLEGAIDRALRNNLGILTGDARLTRARGLVMAETSAFLPEVFLEVGQTRDEFNLDASFFRDFSGPGGSQVQRGVIGPFDVFDARLAVELPLYDASARQDWKAQQASLDADRSSYEERRVLVVLATSSLYLSVMTEQGRVEAADAQLQTARSLADLARDQKDSGLIPELEVLRSEVQFEAARQRQLQSLHGLEKARLSLARAIGLPIGQKFRLSDSLSYEPMAEIDVDEAVALALRDRPDLRAAESQLSEAEHRYKARRRDRWPRLLAGADYGYIGSRIDTSKSTFGLGAFLRMPLFDVTVQAEVLEAGAELKLRRSKILEHRARVHYQVTAALLDTRSGDQLVQVADRARSLATRQLQQARNRFAAGISSNLEVIRAQEDMARTTDWYLDALFNYRNARGVLARAIGISERDLLIYLAGASRESGSRQETPP
jgi:outer membrane protein TolC